MEMAPDRVARGPRRPMFSRKWRRRLARRRSASASRPMRRRMEAARPSAANERHCVKFYRLCLYRTVCLRINVVFLNLNYLVLHIDYRVVD